MKLRLIIVFLYCFCMCGVMYSQVSSDSLSVYANKHEEKNRNVMLNASSSSKPRDISTGLPGDDRGTSIFEDGLPLATSTWPCYPHFHWAGGNGYVSQSLLKMEESALRSNTIGYCVNSYTRLGSDVTHGTFTGTTSDNGLVRFDGAINGKLTDGWYYTLNAYVNMDPTTVHPTSKKYVNAMKLFKAGLTHRWNENRGEATLWYKLSINNDADYGYSSAPFLYKGDGNISKYNGFKLGRDNYFPNDDRVEYLDVVTGEMKSNNISKMNKKVIHGLMFTTNYQYDNGWQLKTHLYATGAKPMDNLGIFESGIDEVKNGKDSGGNEITLSNGASYSGMMQNRLALLVTSDYIDVMGNVALKKNNEKHDLELGLSEWFDYQYIHASSFLFAHGVSKDPVRLYKENRMTWDYNESTEYYRGRENTVSIYAFDDWSPTSKLNIYYGLRAEWMAYHVTAAVNNEGEDCNTRVPNFCINNGIVRLHNYDHSKMNWVGLANISYRLAKGLFLSGEYLYSEKGKSVSNYTMDNIPTMKSTIKQLGRFGFIYDNDWISLTTMFSYINGKNNTDVFHFTKQINGVSEVWARTVLYGIGTYGLTIDAATKLKHFNLHFLSTFQSPKYENFRNSLAFSDGTSQTIDYSDNYVSGMSKYLLEIDPSYQYKDWRVWLSMRYFSRQYANKVNNAYFNGHWETFAGVDYKLNSHLSINLNVINLLNQTGASGTLDVADTITDSNQLRNYLISGTYIRPFTVNLAVGYTF